MYIYILYFAVTLGVPEPEVTWFKAGEPIKAMAGDKRYSIEVDTSDHIFTLEVQNASPADAGEYTITAVNAEGKIFHVIDVTVQAKSQEIVEEAMEAEA